MEQAGIRRKKIALHRSIIIMLNYFSLYNCSFYLGHSFGSHLMGIMAREFTKISNGKRIYRITGLV